MQITILDAPIITEIGEETVLTFDVPIQSYDATPAIIQVADSKTLKLGMQKFDYLIKDCQELTSNRLDVENAERMVNPSNSLYYVLSTFTKQKIDEYTLLRNVKVELIQKPIHGEMQPIYSADNITNSYYIPFVEGFRGKDKVVYALEYKEKRYKVVFNLLVSPEGDLTDVRGPNNCPSTRYIKLNDISNEMSSPYAQTLPAASAITYSFTEFPGTAVGQATGSGTAANILLDINAAGRGWFMDSTPLSNDEYLPTSNPNEWIAKAGSAAADKMDLLSALVGWVEV